MERSNNAVKIRLKKEGNEEMKGGNRPGKIYKENYQVHNWWVTAYVIPSTPPFRGI